MRRFLLIAGVVVSGWLAIAAPASAQLSVKSLPGWRREHVAEAIAPFRAACPHLSGDWAPICAEAAGVPATDEIAARAFVERNFQALPPRDNLFTGYFELTVRGSLTRGGPYVVPVLAPPASPRQYDRAAIERGALAGRGLEIVWLTNAADLYFLQLQGSGRVVLPDGRTLRLGYAAANGRAPVSTTELFRHAGLSGDDWSIPGMRAWIAAHPMEGLARLSRDPSFVFFAVDRRAGDIGHIGAFGAPLAPLRSVAVDPAIAPLGAPLWIDTVDSYTGQPLQRLMLAGDTGDTIHGAHTDIYYGWDQHAEMQGGHMYASGRTWILQPIIRQRVASLLH